MSTEEKKKASADEDQETELHQVEDELHDVEDELHEFEAQQTGISRTLQIIVYPSLVAFVVLAAYGFYLVQSLTTDVHRLTETIASMNETVDRNLNSISGDMSSMNVRIDKMADSTGNMNVQMDKMAASTEDMNRNISRMTDNTASMTSDLRQMNVSTQNMAAATYHMQRDMWSMNKNVSKPFKAMGKFLPFGNSSTSPYMPPPAPYYGVQNAYGWYPAPVQQQPQNGMQITTPAAAGSSPQTVAPAGGSKTTVTGDGHSFFTRHRINTLASN